MCYRKFPDNIKKISVLETLLNPGFNKVAGIMACNFIKKRDPKTSVFL